MEGPWNAEAAKKIYEEDVKKLFKRVCPDKKNPTIVEDNDPTGYKSGKAVAAKKHLKFKVMSLPRYSPDLNPLDFCIWENIETRMLKEGPKSGRETVEQYQARLRQTAMKTSRVLIKKAILNMNVRIKAVYKAKGGHIDMD